MTPVGLGLVKDTWVHPTNHILGSAPKRLAQEVKPYEKSVGARSMTTVSNSLTYRFSAVSVFILCFFLSVFALVTDSGHLIVYNINHPETPWEKIAAHGAGASTLDWHPTRPYVIATGGIADWSVKSMMCLCSYW